MTPNQTPPRFPVSGRRGQDQSSNRRMRGSVGTGANRRTKGGSRSRSPPPAPPMWHDGDDQSLGERRDGRLKAQSGCGGTRRQDLPAPAFSLFFARRSRTPSSPPGARACFPFLEGVPFETSVAGPAVWAGGLLDFSGEGVPPPHPATTPAMVAARMSVDRSRDEWRLTFIEVLVLPRDSTPGVVRPRSN
jgi:hypothetical protein